MLPEDIQIMDCVIYIAQPKLPWGGVLLVNFVGNIFFQLLLCCGPIPPELPTDVAFRWRSHEGLVMHESLIIKFCPICIPVNKRLETGDSALIALCVKGKILEEGVASIETIEDFLWIKIPPKRRYVAINNILCNKFAGFATDPCCSIKCGRRPILFLFFAEGGMVLVCYDGMNSKQRLMINGGFLLCQHWQANIDF